MKLVLYGATGMDGGAALRVALDSPHIETVLSIGLKELGLEHLKLRELALADLLKAKAIE